MLLDLEVLNNFTGDNKVELDTETEEGKQKVIELFKNLLHAGSAIFLERPGAQGVETYRVTGFDPATDSLKVEVPLRPRPSSPTEAAPETETVAAASPSACQCKRCEGCPNILKPTSKTGVCTACQQNKHGGTKLSLAEWRSRTRTVHARPRAQRGDRVTAVGPRAGG